MIDDLEFKLCWSLNNLQPLWASNNHKKSNKVNIDDVIQLYKSSKE